MKYVIFKKGPMVMPIIFHDHITHSDVKAGEGWKPVSAGFCYFRNSYPYIEVNYKSYSESLNLTPNRADGAVLNQMLRGAAINSYMDLDNNIYPTKEGE